MNTYKLTPKAKQSLSIAKKEAQLLKNRYTGDTGISTTLIYNTKTGRMKEKDLDFDTNMNELEQRYRVYEEYIQSLVENLDLQKKEFIVKKGQVIIWAANFIHGAKKINNHNLSRKSLAFHYHFEGQKYYNPNLNQ